jgi:hypothetical protein
MGVYEGRGQLSKAMKQLQMRWQEAQSSWNDAASVQFEKKFLEPLEADLRTAVTAMDHMAAVLVQARRDCQ